MALKKSCSCGSVIDYDLKRCSMCEDRYKEHKAEVNRYYDKNQRNKESAGVYHSTRWIKLTEECKRRFKGLDIYSYYILGKIEYGFLSHHIDPVEDNKYRCYDLDNLIYVSRNTHDLIHSEYNKSETNKRDMQRVLFNLIEKFKKDFLKGEG